MTTKEMESALVDALFEASDELDAQGMHIEITRFSESAIITDHDGIVVDIIDEKNNCHTFRIPIIKTR